MLNAHGDTDYIDQDYGSVYVCQNGCLGSKVPAICKICKEPMEEVKKLGPTMKGPTLDCSEFEGNIGFTF